MLRITSTCKLLPVALAFLTIAGAGACLSACDRPELQSLSNSSAHNYTGLTRLQTAFAAQESGLAVTQQGVIIKALHDDNNGSKHQRFLVALASGQKLLITHNIDIAPRVPGLVPGTMIAFKGEYEWNHKGGVVHWTHHDPQNRHENGWLLYQGHQYD